MEVVRLCDVDERSAEHSALHTTNKEKDVRHKIGVLEHDC
jgi:hypothetical protein